MDKNSQKQKKSKNLNYQKNQENQCHICFKKFQKPCILKFHYRSQHDFLPYACDKCPQVYSKRNDLDRHKYIDHYKFSEEDCDILLPKEIQTNPQNQNIITSLNNLDEEKATQQEQLQKFDTLRQIGNKNQNNFQLELSSYSKQELSTCSSSKTKQQQQKRIDKQQQLIFSQTIIDLTPLPLWCSGQNKRKKPQRQQLNYKKYSFSQRNNIKRACFKVICGENKIKNSQLQLDRINKIYKSNQQ